MSPEPHAATARNFVRFAGACVAAIILAVLLSGGAEARGEQAGRFDYYLLSLSWSPTYCGGPEGRSDPQQCGGGRRFAFVVHGLWPQYDSGWPESCPSAETWVPDRQIEAMLDIMPSKRLIIHEWRTHGSCSGLAIADYFTLTRQLFGRLRIPARYLSPQAEILTTPQQLVSDFVKSNRDLTARMISVQCGNARDLARLSELRICIDRRGNFRQCGSNETRQCRAQHLVMPPVR